MRSCTSGRGGTATVYLARDIGLTHQLAVIAVDADYFDYYVRHERWPHRDDGHSHACRRRYWRVSVTTRTIVARYRVSFSRCSAVKMFAQWMAGAIFLAGRPYVAALRAKGALELQSAPSQLSQGTQEPQASDDGGTK